MAVQPPPRWSGVTLQYQNAKVVATDDVLSVTISTQQGDKVTQISMSSGQVIGGAKVPKGD